VDRDQSGALTLRLLTGKLAEMHALQTVLEAAPEYYLTVTGLPPGNAEAQSMFTALPPGKAYADKFVWGLYTGAAMIGCADVIRGYPAREAAVIGLLLVAQAWQRRGLGRAFAVLLEEVMGAWPEFERLRLGIAATNTAAAAFWRRLGYRETGEVKPAPPGFLAAVHVMEKSLRRHATA
jgi:ribosomal protein S18 acetylase RimI-like enzyme